MVIGISSRTVRAGRVLTPVSQGSFEHLEPLIPELVGEHTLERDRLCVRTHEVPARGAVLLTARSIVLATLSGVIAPDAWSMNVRSSYISSNPLVRIGTIDPCLLRSAVSSNRVLTGSGSISPMSIIVLGDLRSKRIADPFERVLRSTVGALADHRNPAVDARVVDDRPGVTFAHRR